MPRPTRTTLALLALVLAGCAPAHRHTGVAYRGDSLSPDNAFTPAPPVPPVVTPPPPPAPPPVVTNHVAEPPLVGTWISLERWSRRNGLGAPKRISQLPLTFALSSDKGLFILLVGNRSARWNGAEVQLGFAPRLAGGELQMHRLDLEKNLQPLLDRAPGLDRNQRIIVLDPGHGGRDIGAQSPVGPRFEKDLTLDWAKRLQPLLAAEGWTVFLTRTNDVEASLAERVACAERHKADLFLSLHFNSANPQRDRAGLETYCLTPTGMPSNLTRGFADDASQVFPNNAFDAQNLQYAMQLHRALLGANGGADRGVRHSRFLGVLRGQNRPAVLLEGGYLSSPQEARRIADPQYRQKLAEAVARALQ